MSNPAIPTSKISQDIDFKKIWLFLKLLVASVIPAALIFFSRSVSWLDSLQAKGFIGVEVDLVVLKDILLVVGILLQLILLAYPLGRAQLEIRQLKLQNKEEIDTATNANLKKIEMIQQQLRNRTSQTQFLLRYYFKELFETVFFSILGQEKVNLNIRLFIPTVSKNPSRQSNDKYFVIKNIEVLADPGTTNGLVFKVPEQGLVGRCYRTKQIAMDDTLHSRTIDKAKKYNLTENQKSKTCNTAFCLCVPIFSEVGEVVGIVSYDSVTPIVITGLSKAIVDKIITMVTGHSQFLYDYFPEVFTEEESGMNGL